MEAGETRQLPKGHEDGEEAELFVAPYNKTRAVPADTGLLLFVHCFWFVWFFLFLFFITRAQKQI